MTSAERARLRALEAENERLKDTNALLTNRINDIFPLIEWAATMPCLDVGPLWHLCCRCATCVARRLTAGTPAGGAK